MIYAALESQGLAKRARDSLAPQLLLLPPPLRRIRASRRAQVFTWTSYAAQVESYPSDIMTLSSARGLSPVAAGTARGPGGVTVIVRDYMVDRDYRARSGGTNGARSHRGTTAVPAPRSLSRSDFRNARPRAPRFA